MIFATPTNTALTIRSEFNSAGFGFQLGWDTFATPPKGGVVAALTQTSNLQTSAIHTTETHVLTVIAAGTSNAARDMTLDAALALYRWYLSLATRLDLPVTHVESLRAPLVDVQHDRDRTVTEFTVAIEAAGITHR